MRLVRFMSREELKRYLAGEKLHNRTNWKTAGNRSESVGFCFFDTAVSPEERMHYLTGIVNMQTVVEFEPVEPQIFRTSYGIYRDPSKDDFSGLNVADLITFLTRSVPTQKVLEYSIGDYSNRTLKLIRVGFPNMTQHTIKWQKEVNINES